LEGAFSLSLCPSLPRRSVTFKRACTLDHILFAPRDGAASGGGDRGGAAAGLALRALLQIPAEATLRADDGPTGWLADVNRTLDAHGLPRLSPELNHNGLPNREFASDHIPLMAVFEFVSLSV